MTDRSRKRLITLPLAVLTAAVLASPALAGTDGDDEVTPAPSPAPFVQPTEAPPSVLAAPPAPEVAAPATPAAPSVAESKPAAKKAKSARKSTTKKTAVKSCTVANTAAAAATPSGGVQAGGGGTAAQPGELPLVGLTAGGLVLLLSAGGMRVLARR